MDQDRDGVIGLEDLKEIYNSLGKKNKALQHNTTKKTNPNMSSECKI